MSIYAERLKKKVLTKHCLVIVNATSVIEMGDHPTKAFAKKPNSSIAVGFRLLKEGKIDGFAGTEIQGMFVGGYMSVKQSLAFDMSFFGASKEDGDKTLHIRCRCQCRL